MKPLEEKQQYQTTNAAYERYALDHTTTEDALLAELVRETNLAFHTPSMLSGNLQGQFLKMLCQMIQPQMVIEVGTFTGYSAIAMAYGLKPGAMLHTIDNNPEVEKISSIFVAKAGLGHCITLHLGDALTIIPKLNEPFDLAFIDADKQNYVAYYELILERLNPGGFIIADNVLWYGKVLGSQAATDKETRGIADFNAHVKADVRVEQVLLPVRDGLMLIRKK